MNMSLEGGNPKKDEPDLAQKLPDIDGKLSKDRKTRKEKVKPLAKVSIPVRMVKFIRIENARNQKRIARSYQCKSVVIIIVCAYRFRLLFVAFHQQ